VEEAAAPRVAHIFKKAEIPLIAIDVPHPNATYFGVDNFEVGYEAGALLAKHTIIKWNGKADWVLGVGFAEAGSLVQSRISGAFDAIRERLGQIPADRYVQIEGRGMRLPSQQATASFLNKVRPGESILVATATDSSALGVLDAARQAGRERDFAIAGQDCIPEVIEEMRREKSAIVGSVSHEAESYGPRLIQLGISLLRGYTVPPYNYVRHRVVTPETLATPIESPAATPIETPAE
jgi:ribose transport system substrate-binding protein